MIYDGRVYIIQRQGVGNLTLKNEQKIDLKCEKGNTVRNLEVIVKTEKNNLSSLNVENIFLINQDMGMDKLEITKTLGKIRKDFPNDVLGFRPSKKDTIISNFYDKYFEEINSYGVSLISLKQFIGGYFFETFKSVVVKDIIVIPYNEIPESLLNHGTRKRKKAGKHSLNFIMNNKNHDIIENDERDSYNQDELTDSDSDPKMRIEEINKKIKFSSFSECSGIISQNVIGNNDNKQNQQYTNPKDTNYIHITNNTNHMNFMNETFDLFRNSKFGSSLMEYYPLNELNMFESHENNLNLLEIRNLSIYYCKQGPLLYHVENQFPNFDLFPSESKFLNISAKKNVSYQFELTLKFDIPQRVVCLYNNRQNQSFIKCKSKIIINDILHDPPHQKIFKSMKTMVNGIVLVVPVLIEVIE